MFSDTEMKQAYVHADLPQSSTEDRKRTTAATAHAASIKRRSAKRKPAAAAAAASDADDGEDGSALRGHVNDSMMATDESDFRIESMRTFTQQFPHMNMDSQCELATAKLDVAKATLSRTTAQKMRKAMADAGSAEQDIVTLSEHKKDLSVVQSRRLQFDQSQHDPIEVELLKQARAKLVLPDYTHGLTMRSHKESCDLLRRKRLRIPLFTAEHESALMGQHAGTWNIPAIGARTFPPCCYGTQCIGYSQLIPGLTERVTLMRAMSPDEWMQLKIKNTQPLGTGPCILDGRLHTTRYVCKERMGLRPGHTLQREEPEAVYQLWRNLMDEAGGYHSRYVFVPHDNEILIDPIASFHRSTVRATRMPNGMWRVHQDTMVWRPPPLLERQVGDSVQDFCVGAGSNEKPTRSNTLAQSASAPPCQTPAAACSHSGLPLNVRHWHKTQIDEFATDKQKKSRRRLCMAFFASALTFPPFAACVCDVCWDQS